MKENKISKNYLPEFISSDIIDFDSAVSGNTAVSNNTAKISYTDATLVANSASGLASHTGDTSIHYTKGSINLSDLGNSAHTHTVSNITDFPTNISSFTNDSGYITGYTDANTYLTGATVTGTTTKSINLYQNNGSLIQATFTDESGSGGGSGESVTGSTFNTSDGNLTLTTNSGSTIVTSLDGRYSKLPLTGATGTTINLSYSSGAYYNLSSPLSSTSYTTTLEAPSGFAVIKSLSAATEPTVTASGTAIKIVGSNWVTDVDMYLNIYSYDGTNVFYYWTDTTTSGLTITEANISDLQDYALNSTLNTHTGDTTTHFTKSSINLSDLGSSGHTHTVSEITDFPDVLIASGSTRITVGVTQPTSPSVGDLWVDTN